VRFKDGRCLIASARIIAMAAPVDRHHNTIGVERGEHASGDCCNVVGGQEIQDF
jgi:hypothetical protein